jgi:hypothetical protein
MMTSKMEKEQQKAPHLISIGPTCNTTWMFQKIGYRFEAFPFDWLFTSLDVIALCIENEFRDFLDTKYLYDITPTGARHALYNPLLDTPNLRAHNTDQNFPIFNDKGEITWRMFNHHNLTDPIIHESFVRRCTRFMDVLKSQDPVCLVYLNRNTNDCDKIVEFARRMAFRDGVIIIGIIERKDAEDKVLHSERGVIVYETDTPSRLFARKN